MGLFRSDFYRSFAIGFSLGAMIVFGTLGGHSVNPVVGDAVAAPASR